LNAFVSSDIFPISFQDSEKPEIITA